MDLSSSALMPNSAEQIVRDRGGLLESRVRDLAEEAGRLSPADDKKAWKVAENFEAIFINIMLQQMRGTVMASDDSLDSSNASQVYQSLMDEEIARVGSEKRTFGMSKLVHDALVRNMANRVEITKQKSPKI